VSTAQTAAIEVCCPRCRSRRSLQPLASAEGGPSWPSAQQTTGGTPCRRPVVSTDCFVAPGHRRWLRPAPAPASPHRQQWL